MHNILLSSAGRRVSLLNYFKKELTELIGNTGKVYTTDLDPASSPAAILSDGGIKVGKFSDENYIADLLDICIKLEIGLVVPTIDTELLLLSKHKLLFEQNGIKVVVSEENFIKTCRDKRLTNSFFEKNGFLVPKTIDRNNPAFPLFIKPYNGSNSNELYFIPEEKFLTKYMVENENLMFLEYLPKAEYDEYTVDCYYDQHHQVQCIVPRIRLQVRGGEVSKSVTVKNEIVQFIHQNLGTMEGAIGCQTIQLFYGKQNKKIYGIEINPRFGGGFPLSYLAGANYPKWLIKEYLLKEKIEPFTDWENDLLLTRYDTELLVHGYKG